MIVLKATQEAYDTLTGYTQGNSVFKFIEDADGNWVSSLNVLNNGHFIGIRDQLNALERITYKPKPIDI